MRRKLIVLLTFVLAFQVSAEAQEKWELKVNAGTNYAIPSGILNNEELYKNNKTWYPGAILGTSMSYSLLPWLAVESGLNFERIRTGYYAYYNNQTGDWTDYGSGYTSTKVKAHYTKDYLNVPLYFALKTSSNFGFFGGIGYRFCLNKNQGGFKEDWSELFYSGGFFVNTGRISSRINYTQGVNDKSWVYFSKSRTVSLTVGYTLWKK